MRPSPSPSGNTKSAKPNLFPDTYAASLMALPNKWPMLFITSYIAVSISCGFSIMITPCSSFLPPVGQVTTLFQPIAQVLHALCQLACHQCHLVAALDERLVFQFEEASRHR